jgi:hypothetical protein
MISFSSRATIDTHRGDTATVTSLERPASALRAVTRPRLVGVVAVRRAHRLPDTTEADHVERVSDVALPRG